MYDLSPRSRADRHGFRVNAYPPRGIGNLLADLRQYPRSATLYCLTTLLFLSPVACDDNRAASSGDPVERVTTGPIGAPTGSPCPQAGERRLDAGLATASPVNEIEVVSLEPAGFFCRVAARPVLELTPSESLEWPDPGTGPVGQDSRGRLYTSAGGSVGGGMILGWGRDGQFLDSIGRPGEGPGELPSTSLVPYIGPGDSIHVISYDRLTVFGPDYQFARTVARPKVSRTPHTGTCILPDGAFFSVGPMAGSSTDHRFTVMAPDGQVVRSFGDVTPATRELDRNTPQAACSREGTVWTVAEPTSDETYVLELIHRDGTTLKQLRRTAGWAEPTVEDDELGLRLTRLHVDATGNIWIVLIIHEIREQVPESQNPGPDVEEEPEIRVHYEVVSPERGLVLASGELPQMSVTELIQSMPFTYFVSGTNRGVGYDMDPETGFISVEISELVLEQ